MLASLTSLIAAAAVFSSTASASPIEPALATATHYNTAKWQYKGCYQNLPAPVSQMSKIGSAGSCGGIVWGQPLDQIYSAISGGLCYGLSNLSGAVKVADSFCNTPCSGNPSQLCGAEGYFEVFDRIPRHFTSASGSWKWNGCYTGLLPSDRAAGGTFDTAQKCAGNVGGQVAAFTAAAQSGNQCYGLKGIPAHAVKVKNSLCNTPCTGDATQLCGGASGATKYWEIMDRTPVAL
ncbi:hypothetical protein JCM10207_005850 [Rhodosporidiobolus poonsookiae]